MFDYEQGIRSSIMIVMEDQECRDVVDFYKSIKYGSNEDLKKEHAAMLFLADPDFDGVAWVKKAVSDYDTKPDLEEFRAIIGAEGTTHFKAIAMKAYRRLKKKKEPITPISLIDETKAIS